MHYSFYLKNVLSEKCICKVELLILIKKLVEHGFLKNSYFICKPYLGSVETIVKEEYRLQLFPFSLIDFIL